MNPLSSRRRMGSVLTSSTSPTRPASFPDRPTAWPPWWLMSPTICLLILPTRTISTISTVSASVTRMPPTKRGSLPSRFISAPIWGPPPCTMTGLRPTRRRRMTSSAKGSLRSARSIAAPPYLMTIVLPRNSRMYGSASSRTSALFGSVTGSSRPGRSSAAPSQDVPRQVLVPRDVTEARVDVAGVDRQLLAGHVGRVEGDLFEKLLHDRVQAPRADVLRARVDFHRALRDRLHRLRCPPETDPLRPEKLRVLPEPRVLRFRQDADEVVARQGVLLAPHRV